MHTPRWALDTRRIDLAEGIQLRGFEGSEVESLYHRMCRDHHMDSGEPFHFEAMFLVDFEQESTAEFDGPDSTVSRLSNTLAVCTRASLGMCRLWYLPDTPDWHPQSRVLTEAVALLGHDRQDDLVIDCDTARRVVQCWRTYSSLPRGRVINALDFFFSAWRACFPDHLCLNLSIALESLFSPDSDRELAHQIAYYASRHAGRSAAERRRIFKEIKTFYSQRSKIVHGADPKWEKVMEIAPLIFRFCATQLERLLLEPSLALEMNDRTKRRALFERLLFE